MRAAGYVGAFFAGGLVLSALYATTGVGLPCPFRALTGWDCPLCGGTRMGDALLHGDIRTAFEFNPLALVGMLIMGVSLNLYSQIGIVERLRGVRLSHWLVIGLIVAVVYTLVRNLL